MQLGELIEKMTTSDRLVIINAAGQVIYRGYAANFAHGTINPLRRVKRFGLDMETYKRTEKMWDWANIRELPEQIPVEQLGQYDIGQQATAVIYPGDFGGIRHGERKESMADARIAGNGSCCPITAPEMVAENGSR